MYINYIIKLIYMFSKCFDPIKLIHGYSSIICQIIVGT